VRRSIPDVLRVREERGNRCTNLSLVEECASAGLFLEFLHSLLARADRPLYLKTYIVALKLKTRFVRLNLHASPDRIKIGGTALGVESEMVAHPLYAGEVKKRPLSSFISQSKPVSARGYNRCVASDGFRQPANPL
jgi:hypothetical protein